MKIEHIVYIGDIKNFSSLDIGKAWRNGMSQELLVLVMPGPFSIYFIMEGPKLFSSRSTDDNWAS